LRLAEFVKEPDACHVVSRSIRPGGLPPLHDHDFPELFWIESGRGHHLFGGERRSLRAGTFCLVAPADRHGFETSEPRGYHIVNVAFAAPTWRQLCGRYDLRERDPFLGPATGRTWHLDRAELGEVRRNATELLAGRRHRRALERFLLNVVYLLEGRSPALREPDQAPAWLRRAFEALTPAELETGTTALVARTGRSAEHVARECRRWFGKTPTTLVNELRLDLAASWLSGGDQPVLEVALGCGFSNVSHFYRLFFARFATTPAAHRAHHRRILAGR
jgi:AraC family cel operon transcriptional repressor